MILKSIKHFKELHKLKKGYIIEYNDNKTENPFEDTIKYAFVMDIKYNYKKQMYIKCAFLSKAEIKKKQIVDAWNYDDFFIKSQKFFIKCKHFKVLGDYKDLNFMIFSDYTHF